MATVVRGPDFGPELGALLSGIGMIRDRMLHNSYQNEMMDLLSGKQSKIESGIKEVNPNAGNVNWTPNLDQKQISLLKGLPMEDQKAMYEDFMNNKAKENVANVQSLYRPMNESEKYNTMMQGAMEAEALNADYPREMRVNPFATYINDELKKQKALRGSGSQRPDSFEWRDEKNNLIRDENGNPIQVPSIGVPSTAPKNAPKGIKGSWKKIENTGDEMKGRILSMIDNTPDDDPRKPGLIEWAKQSLGIGQPSAQPNPPANKPSGKKDNYEVGKIYPGEGGSKAKYKGNGQWEVVK
jgi:hypothetical protein